MGGPRCNRDDLTMMFSRKMMELIEDLFGVSVAGTYNIYRHPNRFLSLLLNIRTELSVRNGAGRARLP